MLPLWAQSTSCCSLKETKRPLAIFHAPSKAPVVEKDQQEPHLAFHAPLGTETAQMPARLPWFLGSVTAPWLSQSTERGTATPVRLSIHCGSVPSQFLASGLKWLSFQTRPSSKRLATAQVWQM